MIMGILVWTIWLILAVYTIGGVILEKLGILDHWDHRNGQDHN